MNREYLEQLADKISLPAHTREPLEAYLARHEMAVDSMLDQVRKNKGWIKCLTDEVANRKKHPDRYLFALAVVMALSEDTLERYRKKGIPDDIFYATMQDITIWSDVCLWKNQLPGLDNIDWLKNHLVPNLYRIGRLQYQFSEVRFPLYTLYKQRKNAPVHRKEPCVYIHIPAGEPLDDQACSDSIDQAKTFFETYFPDYLYQYYICESWLLDPQNHNILPRQSNILNFAARFQIISNCRDSSQAIERIFGVKCDDINDYPERTTLQKNAKTYMKNKGKLGIAFGVLEK